MGSSYVFEFQPRIEKGKAHQLNVTWQTQRPQRSGSCGKRLDHGEKIAFVVQTF
jgi:hypothetical protein